MKFPVEEAIYIWMFLFHRRTVERQIRAGGLGGGKGWLWMVGETEAPVRLGD